MTNHSTGVRFLKFALAILVVHLTIAAASLTTLVSLELLSPTGGVIVGLIFFGVGAPATTVLTWLIANATTSQHGLVACKVACARGVQLYGMLVGFLVGNRAFGPAGGVLIAASLYFLGRLLGGRLGELVWLKVSA